MTNLPADICLKFKEARKAKGLNQSSLAQMVGCKQSAISMFEGGMVTQVRLRSADTVRTGIVRRTCHTSWADVSSTVRRATSLRLQAAYAARAAVNFSR